MFKIIFILTLLFSFEAYAYLGLGPLIPFLGQLVIFIFSGIIILFGIIIYPFRFIIKKIKKKNISKKKYE